MSKKTKSIRRVEPSAHVIANLARASLTLVHRKLAQGKTPSQIIAEAIEREIQMLRDPPMTLAPNRHAGMGTRAGDRRPRLLLCVLDVRYWLALLHISLEALSGLEAQTPPSFDLLHLGQEFWSDLAIAAQKRDGF